MVLAKVVRSLVGGGGFWTYIGETAATCELDDFPIVLKLSHILVLTLKAWPFILTKMKSPCVITAALNTARAGIT